jgi:hypothetical protein
MASIPEGMEVEEEEEGKRVGTTGNGRERAEGKIVIRSLMWGRTGLIVTAPVSR